MNEEVLTLVSYFCFTVWLHFFQLTPTGVFAATGGKERFDPQKPIPFAEEEGSHGKPMLVDSPLMGLGRMESISFSKTVSVYIVMSIIEKFMLSPNCF